MFRIRAVLLAIAIVCITAAAAWWLVLFPATTALTADFAYEAEVESYDNLYDIESEAFLGEERSKTSFGYKTVRADDNALLIENYFSVETLTGEPIFKTTRLYGIDPEKRTHIFGKGDRDREGFLFAPRMKGPLAQVDDKASFTYWHVNYDAPAFLDYRETETLFGVPVYRYEANINADQTEELAQLPEVGEQYGVTLDIHLKVWVEPYTGYLVKYEDSAEAYFYDLSTGDRMHPWNQFRNAFSDESTRHHAQAALLLLQDQILLGLLAPSLALLVGFLLLVIGLSLNSNVLHRFVPVAIRPYILPSLAFLLLASGSVGAAAIAQNEINRERQAELEIVITEITNSIQSRLAVYESALVSGRGLFRSSDFVDRDEWRTYIESLDIQRNYPGIQGIGYAIFVEPDEVTSVVERVRDEGFDDFRIHPEGERDLYSTILYLEPFDERNRQAFGFDMYQNNIRRTAMDRARDTGDTSLSGKVTLVQEIDDEVQAGFLMYVSYYENASQATIADRRENITGFIYSPFRMNDFIEGTLAKENVLVRVEIFDGFGPSAINAKNRMYSSHGSLNDPATVAETAHVKTLQAIDHPWTILYTPEQSFGVDFFRKYIALFVLVIGLCISMLATLVMYYLSTAQYRAKQMADRLTVDLKQSRDELSRANKEISTRLSEFERINKLMIGRELRMKDLKERLKKYE